MLTSSLLALVASLSTTSAAALQGFNYGSTFTNGAPKMQSDFQSEFSTAKNLVGASGFTSARVYTTVQAGTANSPIQAIPAAIAEGTTLLLGMWASGGDVQFANEIQALKTAISTFGSAFGSSVIGISVGSEDLYRNSPIGIAGHAGIGANPDTLTNYMTQVRNAIAGTALSGVPVGHVDTWTAWVNGSNNGVIAASDFIGMDAYPYFQNTEANSIQNGKQVFFNAYYNTTAVSGGKPVWITETGWPVSGPTENQAVANTQNAKQFWDDVACDVLGKINTFWYTLQDAAPNTPSPSFGLIGSTLTTTPLYDLTCPAPGSSSSSASSSMVSTTAGPDSTASASTASSVGASVAASDNAGVTSVAGSGPIVVGGGSSGAGGSVSAPGTTMVTEVPVSMTVYTTQQVTVTSCGSSISNCPLSVLMTTYPVSTTVYMSGATTVVGGGAGGSAPASVVTSVAVAPNVTLSTGSPSAPASTFTGGAAVAVGSIGGALGVVLAIMAAL
ncbi:hypothetical protein MMC30_006808 [Trapelia coarctata]|nr:hypothetical protein [Trapelia coarctata]